MSSNQIFVSNSEKYPSLMNKRFDISNGKYVLVQKGEVIVQGDNPYRLVQALQETVPNNNEPIQLINLHCLRSNEHINQHIYCVGNGNGLHTPPLSVVYYDENNIQHNLYDSFLIDTGATICCVPSHLHPMPVEGVYIDVSTGAGLQRQQLSKLNITIDEFTYDVLACISEAQCFILGMDILKHYNLIFDGDKSGVLIKNIVLPPN